MLSLFSAQHGVAASLPPINATAYHVLRDLVKSAFNLTASYGTVCYACEYGHTVGALVRLPFHDAAGAGGRPNGCLDFTTSANNDLIATKTLLDSVLSSSGYSTLMSKASKPTIPLTTRDGLVMACFMARTCTSLVRPAG